MKAVRFDLKLTSILEGPGLGIYRYPFATALHISTKYNSSLGKLAGTNGHYY